MNCMYVKPTTLLMISLSVRQIHVNVIILYSVVLMGTSHSIRNKLNIIRGTALKE